MKPGFISLFKIISSFIVQQMSFSNMITIPFVPEQILKLMSCATLCRVDHPASGRFLEVSSTNSTVFAYSNHFMPLIVGDSPCKGGAKYVRYAAIEFMPMGYPNSIKMVCGDAAAPGLICIFL